VAADIADDVEARRVLDGIAGVLPPLRGVVHAAGVLADGLLVRSDWERVRRPLPAKVQGAWNLHLLTRDMPLDFFVLFSSAASVLGSPGQGGYAAGNSFLDALAHARRAEGLPALSVNWGPWSQAGLAAVRGRGDRLGNEGLASLSPEQGCDALVRLLGTAAAQVLVLPLDIERARAAHAGPLPPLLEQLAEEGGGTVAAPVRGGVTIRDELAGSAPARRAELVSAYLRREVGRVLRLDPDRVDVDRPLLELGLDSLMAVELRNRLQADLDVVLPVVRLLESPTLVQLADTVVRHTFPATDELEVGSLLDALDELPEAEAVELLVSGAGPPGRG
jgi:aryl carrier-like protein